MLPVTEPQLPAPNYQDIKTSLGAYQALFAPPSTKRGRRLIFSQKLTVAWRGQALPAASTLPLSHKSHHTSTPHTRPAEVLLE